MKYTFVGKPDKNGIHSHLFNQDRSNLLSQIDGLFPERKKFHHNNFHLLKNNTINVLEDGYNLSISFLHEGAGYKNTMFYYIYDTENPPLKSTDIDELFIIFPNCSYPHLKSGDTVNIPSEVNTYKEDGLNIAVPSNYTFNKGKSIGIGLMANAWKSNGKIYPIWTFFSSDHLNPERAHEHRFHTAVLGSSDDVNVTICGFEDIHREKRYCDHDFNDLVVSLHHNDITKTNYMDSVGYTDSSAKPTLPPTGGLTEYTYGFKKVMYDDPDSGKICEALATLLIPKTSTVVNVYRDGKFKTERVYVQRITALANKMEPENETKYIQLPVDTILKSARSYYNKDFVYTKETFVEETLEYVDSGIHFFKDKDLAAFYHF